MIEGIFDVTDKIALVTGGARGIGSMISKALVEAGAKVYVSSRSAERCEAFAEEMSKIGTCKALPMDLSKVENIESLVAAFGKHEEKLDILINNAGVSWGAEFSDFPEKGWDKVMDLNTKSIFFMIQKFHPLLAKAGSPESPSRVINFSSVMSESTVSLGAFSYSASKAAVTHLTKCLARELGNDNILVNAIAPGFFPTDMTAHIPKDQIAKNIPLKRLGGEKDMAGLILFLCSRASAYMTGNFIPVDGGFLVA